MPKGVYIRSETQKAKLRTLFSGHHHTEHSRIKTRLSMMAHVDDVWRERARLCRLGKRHKATTRRKMSLSAKKGMTVDRRRVLSEAAKNRNISDCRWNEIRKTISKTWLAKYKNGYKPTGGSAYAKRGLFKSVKNDRNLLYRSVLERDWYGILENREDVFAYAAECLSIPYVWCGVCRTYIPDILVTFMSGAQEVWEVKPEYKHRDPQNISKWRSAKKWCRVRNMTFRVVGYKELSDRHH